MLVELSERAIEDLDALAGWVAEHADIDIALAYVSRLRVFAQKIGDRPHGGTPRGALGEGFRSVTFERRQIVVYRVEDEIVRIYRVMPGARRWEAEFVNDL